MTKIRTRFAPSPTGRMHVGNLRTALYAYLITKHEDGDFILRIEDTDQEREVEGAVDIIKRTLSATGLIHDEGPDKDKGYGPYVQSERQAQGLYLKYAKELVEKGVAVRILNMGNAPIDNSPTGMLMLNIMLSFAEFERDMIVQRTQEGKAASGNYGGRKSIYTKEQIDHAMELLNGSYSYTDVVKMTGISKSTLIRARKRS